MSRVLGAAGLATVAAVPTSSPFSTLTTAYAVTAGYALPLSQDAINANYGGPGGCCPMNAQTCHHNACYSVPNTFWAIDLFQGLGATEFAWASGWVQYSGFDPSCGNRVRWGTAKNAGGTNAGLSSMYCHGDSIVSGAGAGQWVTSNQPLMKMGNTGTGSNGVVHLHFDHRYLLQIATYGGVNPVSGSYNGYCTRLMIDHLNNNLQPNPTYGYTTTYGIINGACA